MGIFYATREQVASSLEITSSAYAGSLIDAKIDKSSRDAEQFLHRRFYPELRTILKDWPNNSYGPTWEIDLQDQELISVFEVLSGGTDITSDVLLRRGDDLQEPPYSTLQVDLSSSAAFTSGVTFQQSISINGLYGYNDTSTNLAGGVLNGAINSSVNSIVINSSQSDLKSAGIGSLLKIDSERMVVTDRRMRAFAGNTLAANLDAQKSDNLIAVTDGTAFVTEEIILIDGERMRVKDIAGNNLIVERAFDGTVLDTHTSATAIYGLRTYIVKRGVLGSTAAAHSDAVSVYVHEYPSVLTELTVAETVVALEQNAGAYARVIGSGASAREAKNEGLADVRDRAWMALGRKCRSAAI